MLCWGVSGRCFFDDGWGMKTVAIVPVWLSRDLENFGGHGMWGLHFEYIRE